MVAKTRIVVLAGGKGRRMRSELDTSKTLAPLKDKPIIKYLLDSIGASGVDPRPIVVVGHGADDVKAELGPRYEYVLQEEQLGTGHAVRCAESALTGSLTRGADGNAETVIVLYGDQPFIRSSTIANLFGLHAEKRAALTMVTTRVDDYEDWRAPFYDFGRMVRDARGKISRIVEKADATPEELEIREVNPSFFCFNAAWLWDHLPKLKNDNAKGEYYLTDLVRIAIDEGEDIASMEINPLESIGVNTPEHLKLVTGIYLKNFSSRDIGQMRQGRGARS